MIVKNQSNIKVHFAGAEQFNHFICASNADVKYVLWTVFPFIASCLGLKASITKSNNLIEELKLSNIRHSIMDSGLFTLMFGAHAGKRTEKEIEIWYSNLVNYVIEKDIPSTIVEVDCQKILGVEKAWELRKRMKNDLPNHRQINVFHKDDGQKGLDKMIEFSDYIAISVPELRNLGQKNDTIKIANYIKNKKPDIDIHLLGCTDKKMLNQLSFCSSSDSTSWLSLNRWGIIGSSHIKEFDQKLINEKYGDKIYQMFNRYNINNTQNQYDYYARTMFSAEFEKGEYTRVCGDQN